MSFPAINTSGTCTSCKQSQSDCSCTSKTSQSAIPMQSLPRPVLPCNNENVPADYYTTDQVLWAGADNDTLGIKNGDTLTKVLNIIMQLIP